MVFVLDNSINLTLQQKEIQHDIFGERSIENIDGTAKGIIFYNEVGRDDLEDYPYKYPILPVMPLSLQDFI